MDNRQKTLSWMDEQGVAYECVEHEAAHTMEDIEAFGVNKKGMVCKNLFLRDSKKGKRHYLVTVCGDKPVDLKMLGDALGDRLSFASENRLEKYLHLKQGEVTPLGVLFDENSDVSVFFDEDLRGQEVVGVHPCDNTATVFLRPDDLAALVQSRGNVLKWVHI